MILPLSLQPLAGNVAHTRRDVVHLMDTLRDEAALELDAALGDVSGKRIRSAAVPGAGRTGISRARHGSDTNPLYRLAGMFVLMKRLGMGRERAQRIVNWLQELVDVIWGEEDLPPLEDVLDAEQDLDSEDDPHQQRIGRDPAAVRRMLDCVRRRHAHDQVVILALRRELAEQG